MSGYAAAVCTDLSGPDAVGIEWMARKPLKAGEVRLRVHAAALNFPDLLMTRGLYQLRPEPPFIPGLEVAGEVIEVAKGSKTLVGERVCAATALGGFAEEAVVLDRALKPWPKGYTPAEAAGFYVTAFTAWHGLVDRGAAQPGERLLVLGAGGGVGLAAVKLGCALGLEVVAAARNPKRLEAAGAAGAASLVESDGSMRAAIEDWYGKRPMDLVFDPVGGPLAEEAAGCLNWGGRYLVIGFAAGGIPKLAFNRLLLAGYGVLGVRAGEAARRDPAIAQQGLEGLFSLGRTHNLRPVIGLDLPLSQASDALHALDRAEVIGKAVLTMG
tara:strand:+ start:453 stop:1433 length:981 start_codon:yes stop_codon:yes gene_type:complete